MYHDYWCHVIFQDWQSKGSDPTADVGAYFMLTVGGCINFDNGFS